MIKVDRIRRERESTLRIAARRSGVWTQLLIALCLSGISTAAAVDGPASQPTPGNHLALEASPFLRLHAQDPIDWRPFGDEALAEAAKRRRPLFVSIGYATCTGCREMAKESFRDPAVAAALNAGFVSVMVDRDATPELADAYARLAASMGERVGYPLHVFLLPDGSAFHTATFLPRNDEPGRTGILTVLASVARAVQSGGEPLARRGAALRAEIARDLQTAASAAGAAPGARELSRLVEAQRQGSDPEWGGRLDLPKRPGEPSVALLLRHHRRSGDARSLEAALRSLERMAASPVRGADGGFYEGATRSDWSGRLPERRLADNARLALAYLEGWQASGRAGLREVARGILGFLLAELRAPEGAFHASLHRGQRDAQLPAGANGLAISALSRGGFALSEPRLVAAAQRAAGFALENLRGAEGLVAFAADGRKGPPATLSDHALLVAGLLDLLEVDADARWLTAALRLQSEQDALFAHPDGGYFATRAAPGPGLPRPRHARDGALPSGQATAALNLLRLHGLTGDSRYRARADAILSLFREGLAREPFAHATLGLALDARLDGLHEIVVVVTPGENGRALLEPLRTAFVPNRVLVIASEEELTSDLVGRARLLAGRRAIGGVSTAFVCVDQVCDRPARDAESFARQLARFTPLEAGG